MFRTLGRLSLLVALASVLGASLVRAQSVEVGRHSRPRITANIDEQERITLRGNTHPEARQENDRGKAKDDLPMQHLLLQLRRSPEQEKAVQKFIDALHDAGSPEFHKWLTADEFGDRFGVADQDLEAVTHWLRSHGFKINVVYPSGMVIDFSGTAEQVGRAFGTEIHDFEVQGTKHTGNINDPQIPAALASVVVGIVSMHDFRPQAMHVMRNVQPKFTFNGLFGTTYALVPADLATIYNFNPLFNAGYSGQGQTIALIEDTDVFSAADWSAFRSTFGLSRYTSGSFKTIHPPSPTGPNNCAAPGVIAPNDAEAILDAEWASAAAPSAAVEIVSCADTTATFGGLIAIQNLINSNRPPAIVSVSYGQCEAVNGAAANAAFNSVYQQAVAEGVSVFVAAGDSGAAGCDNNASEATHGVGANALASTPYNVAVGGTDFSDTYSGTNGVYWSSTNTSAFASATSYIPEIPWNNSCAGALISNYLGFGLTYGSSSLCNDSFYGPSLQTTVAGGGSPSACATGAPSTAGVVSGTCQGWPKPSWQNVFGNPKDGVRDTPDVSLFAADGLWSHYYVFCWSDTANGGAACGSDPSAWSGAGGTSFSAPILAGIQALVNQKLRARQGNPNPVFYQLAAAEYGSSGSTSCNSTQGRGVSSACVFYDVTQGDMDVNCTGNSNCYDPSGPGTQGVLSTSNNSFSPAYGTKMGWDFATGIGTLNATNLVTNWPTTGPVPSFFLTTSSSSLTITQGNGGTATITVNPVNGFTGSVGLSASGLPSGVTATFNPASATSTSTLTLTTSSTAAVGAATITVTGTSGLLTNSVTITLTVNSKGNFTLSASPSNLSIFQGASGTSTITVTPQNGFNASVTLSASGLPTGVTATFNPSSTTGSSTLTLAANNTATTGTYTVNVAGLSGSLNGTCSIALTIVSTALPSGWSNVDVGVVGAAGSASYANGTFTVQGSGAQIWDVADGFQFVYQPLSGDGTIIARVTSLQGGGISQSAGLMVRETLTAGSTNVYTTFGRQSLIYFDERATTGSTTSSQNTTSAVSLPVWLKLARSGNTFTGYLSPDGVNWTQVGVNQTVPMAASVYIGLAVNGSSNTALSTATFDNVSITPSAAPSLPVPWVNQDVGQVGIGGGASDANGTFTVQGSGAQIWDVADGFQFVYQPWSGDGTIIARVLSMQGGGISQTAGLMVRETLTAGSTNVYNAFGRQSLIYFDERATTGSTTSSQNSGSAVSLPIWLKLVRSGNTFTGYLSTDSVNWTQVGTTQTVPMAAKVYIGLAVASNDNALLTTTTFDSVSVTAPAPSYSLSASPGTLSVLQGGSGTSTIMVTPQNGFNASVNLSASGLPTGVTATFNPSSTTGSSTLTLAANSTAPTGTFSIIVSGISGALTNSTTLSLTIAAPPSFTLSASPNNLTIAQGATGSSTVTVAPQNGFSGSVSFSASNLPNGVTATFTPPSSTSTSTLTLTAASTAATGTFTVNVNGSSGTLTSTTSLTVTVTAVANPSLPPGWSNADVGVVGAAGSASYANGTFTVQGSGAQIWDVADGFQFVYQPLSGDGTIIARVTSLQGGGISQSAGLMVRETLTAGSTNVYTTFGRQSLIYFDERATTGSTTSSQNTASAVSLPVWLKLVRGGNTFTGYLSPDGVNWTQVGVNQTVPMAASVYIGLAVNGSSSTALSTATFDNVSITPSAAPSLPVPWVNQDVGQVGIGGGASDANGTFTVEGSGAQIWDVADGFQFVYQPWSGDGTIIARVLSMQGGGISQTAGLMVRETLTAGSTNVYNAFGRQSLIYFDERATTGSTTSSQNNGSAVSLPVWLKLVRSGNTFTGYLSTDSVNWTQVGTTQTVPMAAKVYIGLAVASNDNTLLTTAAFDNVAVGP